MISPGRYDIGADRWVACIRTFAFVGVDFTGADVKMQVRLKADTTGTPLVELGPQVTSAAEGINFTYAGTATVADHIAAGRIPEVPAGYALTDSVVLTLVQIRINETTMESLPYPGERGDDADMAWDLHITPSGGIKDKYIGGKFIVRAGVTQ